MKNRKEAIPNMHQVLIKRAKDALRKALAGDLSLLKELVGPVQRRLGGCSFGLGSGRDQLATGRG